MKRVLVLTLASTVALSMASYVLAGPAGTQGPKKQSISGTIEKINAKQHMVVVKETTGQQIQTQSVAQKEGKGKKARTVSVLVDDKTEIVAKSPALKGGKVVEPGQQPVNTFGLLQVGQVVRVVYVVEEQAVAPPTQQAAPPVVKKKKPQPEQVQQQQPIQQQQQPVQQQVPVQQPVKKKNKPQQDAGQQAPEAAQVQAEGKKGAPVEVQVKPKRVARALRIEILTQPTAQQAPVSPQPVQEVPAAPAQVPAPAGPAPAVPEPPTPASAQ